MLNEATHRNDWARRPRRLSGQRCVLFCRPTPGSSLLQHGADPASFNVSLLCNCLETSLSFAADPERWAGLRSKPQGRGELYRTCSALAKCSLYFAPPLLHAALHLLSLKKLRHQSAYTWAEIDLHKRLPRQARSTSINGCLRSKTAAPQERNPLPNERLDGRCGPVHRL